MGSLVFAQDQGGRGGNRGGGGFGRGGMQMGRGNTPMSLVNRADVQADLNLTTDQKNKLTELRNKQQEEMRSAMENLRGGGGGDPNEMMQQMREWQEKNDKAIAAVLTTEQNKRVKEIWVQLQGNRAILDEGVQKDLGFSAEQQQKVKSLQERQQEAMRSLMERMRNQEIDREQMREIQQKNNEIMNTELGKVLTSEQAEKLKAMGGKPFKATEQPRGGGRGGGVGS
jgi:Spy/CpxP family protein refolding chaperone